MATSAARTELVPQLWSKKVWADAEKELYFKVHGFIGEGEDSIIQKKTNLAKNPGDTDTFPLVMKLSGNGITGDSTLEGNEESLTDYYMTVSIDQIRHGVRLAGKLEEQKAAYSLREQAKSKLKTWLAEYLNDLMFTTLGTSPTTNRKFLCSADHSTVGTLDSTDLLTTAYISEIKRKAMLASPKIRPVTIKGKKHYVMVVHPYVARDLKLDEKWLNAQKDANLRGEDNPLFSGALGVWDGVILHEHESVLRDTDGASSAYVAYNLFMGCQAGVWEVAKEPFWKEKEFDYQNQVGFATGLIHGFKKSVFNSEDYGLITAVASAAAD